VPQDIYYWYIVHPKITDEIPAYINPAITENNSSHSNNISPPPDGKFWRSYLYTVQEAAYPVLRDTLMQCQTAFNRTGTAGDAIRAIQWWINSTMSFTSNAERPHQPVRIYKKHFGRCGEYADYTSAVSRIALIPCTSILSASTDHTWNEFWEDGWVQWEPVNGYINTPLVYENGWGKVFGTVFEIRSDGYLSSVTDRYSEGTASITIVVKDSLNRPIDGARVILGINESGIRVDMIGFTDNNGVVNFIVGENRHYYARVESSVGIFPTNPGTYQSLVDNSVNGGQYSYQMVLTLPKPVPQVTEIPAPPDLVDDWRFVIQFNTPNQILYGKVTWDDLSANGASPYFYKGIAAPGRINLLMTDADNYLFYGIDHTAQAIFASMDVMSGSGDFPILNNQDWFAFLDNSSQVANAQLVTGVMVYEHYGTANNDNTIPQSGARLYQNYPNPFYNDTSISFNLPKTQKAKLTIYNLKGQKVRTLLTGDAKSGLNTVKWDGKDDNDNPVSSGIYYYRLVAQSKTTTRKMLLYR
ncbi:MAG: T9SS type A sorting domain-containing protein, partial [Candidatus Cloacimonetes bacterium]|nr:T9SS type A sorting domain-containing protein [Candidatus Cloacimonadota bacterium]